MSLKTVLRSCVSLWGFLMTTVITIDGMHAFPKSSIKNSKGCPDLISPERGTFVLSEDGLSVEFLCRPGHSLVGPRQLFCRNGLWSDKPPICVGRDCEMPVIRGGAIISLHGGGIIRILCRTGFSLISDGSEFLACIDGRWNVTNPACINNRKKENESVNSPKNRNHFVGKHPKDSESKQEQASKKSHKDWLQESDYSCVGHDTTVYPPSVPNARALTRWAMYDALPRLYTTYQCKWGFKPTAADGIRNVYCRNKEWIGSPPKCQSVNYEDQSKGDFSGNTKSLSHEELLLHADYSCIESSFGDNIDPPVLENTLSTVLRFVILEGRPHLYVEYACKEGFELQNALFVHLYCKQKRWIGEAPKCVPVSPKQLCAINNGGCEQSCGQDDRGNVICSCKEGFLLESDKATCRDVDECEVNGGYCEHLCDNTLGSFKCSCFSGYALELDKKTCSKIQNTPTENGK